MLANIVIQIFSLVNSTRRELEGKNSKAHTWPCKIYFIPRYTQVLKTAGLKCESLHNVDSNE